MCGGGSIPIEVIFILFILVTLANVPCRGYLLIGSKTRLLKVKG